MSEAIVCNTQIAGEASARTHNAAREQYCICKYSYSYIKTRENTHATIIKLSFGHFYAQFVNVIIKKWPNYN